ncbi:MAG: hypothetical protein HQL39_05500, partial [Alphaproteobacteria bacterium]|nr:hypothetical protein [Alphaproteobacteria bacterium]
GFVARAEYQPQSADWEIFLVPAESDDWFIALDHLATAPAAGTVIAAGDPLGTATGSFGGITYRYEVGAISTDLDTALDPWSVFDPAAEEAARAAITRLVQDDEAFHGDAALYDESLWVGPASRGDFALPVGSWMRSGGETADTMTGGNGRDTLFGLGGG